MSVRRWFTVGQQRRGQRDRLTGAWDLVEQIKALSSCPTRQPSVCRPASDAFFQPRASAVSVTGRPWKGRERGRDLTAGEAQLLH